MSEPLSVGYLQQIRAMLDDDYAPVIELVPGPMAETVKLLLGTSRKLLAHLDAVLDLVETADDRLNRRGDAIACHLYLDQILKEGDRRD
jgi:hypothetical protein